MTEGTNSEEEGEGMTIYVKAHEVESEPKEKSPTLPRPRHRPHNPRAGG